MVKNKIIDIKGKKPEEAVSLLCEEINLLRRELNTAFEILDGEMVIMPDGMTLSEKLKKFGK